MSSYPGAIDSPASLYSPVDAFSTKSLETATTGAVLIGDSAISVVTTTGGFAASYGVLSIDDELIVYTAKTGSQFTGCVRGAFGTVAAAHSNGAAVKANMVAGFITALQSAVLAIENELGTAAARNYIVKNGAVTVTGLKTFQDGAEFGTGTKAGTGLVRLPNLGSVKWRKQDNSGDLGIALNASNHFAMDAVIDFAAGQTFGAFSYPDATTLAKGIVQIDSVGGLAVAGGVVSLADTAVVPGTYTKTTVDQKGRVTAGALLAAGDLPSHTHTASDITAGSLPFTIQNNGAAVGTRRALNLIQGANIGLTLFDVPASDRVNVTVALASVPAHTHPASDVTSGTLALARGGTGASLSGTGPGFLKQTGVGAAVTVAALVSGDLPSHTHAGTDITSAALHTVLNAAVSVGTRRGINLIEGANVTLTVVDDAGNDRVNITIAASAGGGSNHNLLSGTHSDTVAASPVLGDLIAANSTPSWQRVAGNTTATRKFLRQTGTGTVGALPAWDTLLSGDLPAHNHAASDVNSGTLALSRGGAGADLSASGPGFLKQTGIGAVVTVAALAAADIPAHDTSKLTSGTLALARGGVGADLSASGPGFLKQASVGAAVTVAALASGDLPTHTHTSAQITDATAAATASTLVLRDGSAGANFAYVAANNLWSYLDSHLQSVESGPYGTVGGPYENMLKYSEDFSVGTWDKNGGTCTVVANSIVAPDGNSTADAVTASGAAGLIRQNIAGLVANGQYTFYVWLKVASGTMTVSLGILDNGWTTWLVGPTAVTLTTSWQRFKVTAAMTGGATALWVAIGHYTDGWTSGLTFHAWGACLQQGNDPKKGYARTWGYQASPVAAGVACSAMLVAAKDNAETPFRVAGPGSNLADHTLLQVTASGELIIAGSTGNGYRLAELMGANNPSGWSGVIKVKTPAGATAGYILLYSNP